MSRRRRHPEHDALPDPTSLQEPIDTRQPRAASLTAPGLLVAWSSGNQFQLWVNLPSSDKLNAPRYQDLRSGEVAPVSSRDGGSLLRVIAGEVAGHPGPGATHTPMAMVHSTVAPGAQLELPWRPGPGSG